MTKNENFLDKRKIHISASTPTEAAPQIEKQPPKVQRAKKKYCLKVELPSTQPTRRLKARDTLNPA